MDIKNFVLSYYKNVMDEIHIHKVDDSCEAEKPHTHDYFQIYYVITGSIVHYIYNKSARLSCGDVFIVPPNTRHYIKRNEESAVFYSFSFMYNFFDGLDRSNKLACNFLNYLKRVSGDEIEPKLTIPTDEAIHVEMIMKSIMKEFTNSGVGAKDIIRCYAVILVSVLARVFFSASQNELSIDFETNKSSVMHCIDYIGNNFTEDITLSEIIKRSTMSKTSFCTLFSSLTGYSFKAYLNMLRVEKAKSLIKSDYKITSASNLCGYSDFTTFYRNFKKFTGLSPAEYKRICLPSRGSG